MKNFTWRRMLLMLFTLVAISAYWLYEKNSSQILIIIVDGSGTPITHAQIQILRYSIGPNGNECQLDKDGSATVTSFLPAIEQIVVSAPGYQTESYHPAINHDHKKVFVLQPN